MSNAVVPQRSTEDRAAGGQRIDGSQIFDSTFETYLSRTPKVIGNTQKWTVSFWYKQTAVNSEDQRFIQTGTSTGSGNYWSLAFLSNMRLHVEDAGNYSLRASEMMRDPGKWYHIVVALDTHQTTSANRLKIYINGSQVDTWDQEQYPTIDTFDAWNKRQEHAIGCELYSGPRRYLDANLSQFYHIDGQQLAASDFGYSDPLTGVWRPKKFEGDFKTPSLNLPEVWSYKSTNITNAANAFNGKTAAGTGDCYANAGADSDGYWDLPVNIVATKVECYIDPAHTSVTGAKFYARDTGSTQYTYTTSSVSGDSGWVEIPLGGATRTINRLGCTRNSGGSGSALFGWRITNTDSTGTLVTEEILIDDLFGRGNNSCYFPFDGENPIGQDQSARDIVNDGTTWSDNVTGTFWSASYDEEKMFDGDMSTGTEGSGDNTNGWSPPVAMNGHWRMYVLMGNWSSGPGTDWDFKINGSSIFSEISSQLPVNTDGWVDLGTRTIDPKNGSTDGFQFSRQNNANNYMQVRALEFNGTILTDNTFGNDWTPKRRLSGSVAFDQAKGAFPILNTISGGRVAVPGVRGQVGVAVTVYNDGGGNKYYLDGVKSTDKNVKFAPGQTVTFDTGDSTCSGHPFRISENWDGSHNSYMSVDFDGVDGVLQYSNDAGFNFGKGKFTIEFWARVANVLQDHAAVVSLYLYGGGPFIKVRTSNEWSLYFNKDGGGNDTHNICGIGTYGEWHHIAWVREGIGDNQTKFYFDGEKVYEACYPTDIVGDNSAGHGLTIGKMQPSGGSTYFEGKLRDVRISKGVARYTSNFCPPSKPLTVDGNTSILVCNNSSKTAVSGNYTGVATAIGGVAVGYSQDPFKEYVYGTSNTGISEGTVGAATTITIPNNAPGELTYYCTAHTGMGGTVSVGATDPNVADPYAWRNFLATPLNDVYDRDYSDKVNTTSATKTLTASGNPSPSTLVSNFYAKSYLFDGSSDYFSTSSSDDFQFGAGNFTIECWVYSTAGQTDEDGIFQISTTSGGLDGSSTNTVSLQAHGGIYRSYADDGLRDFSSYVVVNKWVHLALVRDSGTLKLFVNGVQDTTTFADTKNYTGTYLAIGGYYNTGYLFTGNISDFRVYKSVAKYNSNFVPATRHSDILPDTPSGVPYKSLLKKPTTGSVLFNGTGDRLSLLSSSDVSFGTGEFTIELWFYNTDSSASSTNRGIMQVSDTGGGLSSTYTNGWFIGTGINASSTNDNGIRFRLGDGSNTQIGGNQGTPFVWHHIAVTRDGSNVIRMFVDGMLIDSVTNAYDFSATNLVIGGYYNTSYLTQGFISNVRLIKGTALYTANFTPPTKPLTEITNTKLLCCQDTKLAGAAAVSPLVTGGLNNGRVWSAHGRWQFAGDSHSGKSNGDPIIWHASGPGNQMFNGAEGAGSNATYPSPNGAIAWYCDIPCSTSFRVKTNQAQQPGDVTITTDSGTASATLPGTGNASGSGQTWTTVTLPGSTTKITKIQFPHDEASGWVDIGAIEVDGTNLTDPISPYILKGQNNYTQTVAGSCEGELIATSFNPFDKDIHTVRGQETQYATLTSLIQDVNAGFDNGALTTQVTGPCTIMSSIPMYSGKWYCEIINTAHGSTHMGMGIAKIEGCDGARQPDEGQHRGGWAMWHISGDGSYRKLGWGGSWGSQSTTWEDWGVQWGASSTNDVMGMALDMDNRTLMYFKNGVNMGTNENGLTKTLNWGAKIDAMGDNGTILPNTSWTAGEHGMVFVVGNGQSGATSDFECNFGQRPWRYAPPSGYQAASIANCYARPTIVRPDKQYFTPVIWTGTGAAKQIDLGFQPDLVWIKDRTNDNYDMRVFDSIRGMNGETSKALYLDTSDAEATNNSGASNNDGALTANATGFLISTSGDRINKSSNAIVAYGWKAGGNKGTWNVDGEDRGSAAAAGLTTGDTSVLTGCSINTKAGFSIVTYTQDSGGASKNIAHGLSKAPSFVIMKHVNNSSSWYTVHTGIENEGKILYTDSNSDQDTSSDFGGTWPGATYTSTSTTGVSGRQLVLYSWTNTKGLQWFGQYEGNGDSSKGVYVNLGFKPAMLWIKRTDASDNWILFDNKRETINPRQNVFRTNSYTGEDSSSTIYVDFINDGFKMYNTANEANSGGAKYLYMAWAETPTFNLYGAP